MIIKLILITALVLAGLFAYRAGRGARSLAARRIGFLLAMGLCIVAVLAPSLISRVAIAVGVGRGTDLVLYVFVMASLFIWIGLYRRLHDMEERFVDLARQIALGKISPPEAPPVEGTPVTRSHAERAPQR
jgi:hypothetical protein